MDRQQYNACIATGLKGKQFSKDERKLEFCVLAKTCSGKVKTRDEAITICSQPKEPKAPKASKAKRGQTCEKEVMEISQCMVDKIDMNLASNINSVGTAIANAMMECKCPSRE